MDITHLKTFIELSRTRHFGKAANALCITQSAVSARIRLLEESLGVKLLTRDRNNIQLTSAGTRFLPHAAKIVNTWAIARQETALQEENQVLLSIGAAHSLWDAGLQHKINNYYMSEALIALNLESQSHEQLFRFLMEGSLDVCFMFEQPQLIDLQTSCVGQLELVLASTHKQHTSLELVQRHDYVYVDWGTEFTSMHAKAYSNTTLPSLRVGLARLGLNFVKEHGGSAYLAKSTILSELERGELYLVQDAPSFTRDYYVAYKNTTQKIEQINALLNQIQNS